MADVAQLPVLSRKPDGASSRARGRTGALVDGIELAFSELARDPDEQDRCERRDRE